MKQKKFILSFFLVTLSLVTFLTCTSNAQAEVVDVQDTEIGIGFNTKEDPSEEEPPLLPNTNTPKNQAVIYNQLPRTNFQDDPLLALIGCLLVGFVIVMMTHPDKKKVQTDEE